MSKAANNLLKEQLGHKPYLFLQIRREFSLFVDFVMCNGFIRGMDVRAENPGMFFPALSQTIVFPALCEKQVGEGDLALLMRTTQSLKKWQR